MTLPTLSLWLPTNATLPSLRRAATCCSGFSRVPSRTVKLEMGAPRRGTYSWWPVWSCHRTRTASCPPDKR